MKTPMQEHIEWLKEKYKILADMNLGDALEIGDCIENAEKILDKEKEVIQRAYKQGVIDEYGDTIDLDTITEAEEYYNKTFNTKDKLNRKDTT